MRIQHMLEKVLFLCIVIVLVGSLSGCYETYGALAGGAVGSQLCRDRDRATEIGCIAVGALVGAQAGNATRNSVDGNRGGGGNPVVNHCSSRYEYGSSLYFDCIRGAYSAKRDAARRAAMAARSAARAQANAAYEEGRGYSGGSYGSSNLRGR